MSDFFVGYRPVSKTTRRGMAIGGLIVVVASAALAAILALSQQPFDPGTFEFGQIREFEGWLRISPVPSLRVLQPARPGQPPRFARYPLVSFGKFGAPSELDKLDGQRIQVSGSLIYNNQVTMLELSPNSWTRAPSSEPTPPDSVRELGRIDVTGEIVDSKCFLGVMKPGRFKVHRDCAVRCISGGIPPLLLVKDQTGAYRHFFLVAPASTPLVPYILDRVAETVRVQGDAVVYDDLLVLKSEPAKIERQE